MWKIPEFFLFSDAIIGYLSRTYIHKQPEIIGGLPQIDHDVFERGIPVVVQIPRRRGCWRDFLPELVEKC